MSNKIYGTRIVMTGKVQQDFVHWYSDSKETSDQLTACAKAMGAPENVTVEFIPVESDVIITERGTYKLSNGEKVVLNFKSGIVMHGYAIVRGKSKMNRPVAFYINGEPSSRASKTRGAKIVEQVSAYAAA
jgi:uncharacterized Fe-S cluster protein YjdI